jgi:hypothetical protein
MEIVAKAIALMLFMLMGASYYCFCRNISRDVLEMTPNGKTSREGGEASQKEGDRERDIAFASRFSHRGIFWSKKSNEMRDKEKKIKSFCSAYRG